MTVMGVGPKMGVPTFTYLFATIIIDYFTKPLFQITEDNYPAVMAVGLLLLAIALVILIVSGVQVMKAFNQGKLATDGLFRIFRNPLYANYVIFLIPGLALVLNSWLVLTSSLVLYIILLLFIQDEYKYLEDKFGNEYKVYVDKVWFKFL